MGPGQLALLLHARPAGGVATLLREGEVGLVDVTPFGALVTDSAAGATALSTGVQTRPRMIAVGPDGERVPTLMEQARALGYSTGVVTTADLTDATPAAFLAHAVSRNDAAEIAAQIVAAPPTVALGGGARWFPAPAPGMSLEAAGDLPYAREGRIRLQELTERALGALGASGFVLLVEAARIDDACHGHRAPDLLGELLDLDDAVTALLPRARAGELLLVLTADHETGGFALQYRPGNAPGARPQSQTLASGAQWSAGADFVDPGVIDALLRGETPPAVTWSSKTHTAALIPLVALGPGAETFRGFLSQAEVGRRLQGQLRAP